MDHALDTSLVPLPDFLLGDILLRAIRAENAGTWRAPTWRSTRRRSHSAGFATCRQFAKACLASAGVTLLLSQQAPKRSLLSVLRWLQDSGNNALSLKGTSLPGESDQPRIRAFLRLCHAQGLVLSNITSLNIQNLELDSDPSLLHSVFPCAHHYHIEQCPLPTHARPLSHATSLSHLTLRPPAHRSPAEWRAQLQALESLPGLCSVDLSADMFTEGVTPRLAQQLTSMTLLAFNGDSLSASTNIKCLYRLRELVLSVATGNVSGTSSFDLPLQAVLQLSQLTRLEWPALGTARLQQSYAEAECSWRQLRVATLSLATLPRLPLRGLTALHYAALALSDCVSVCEVSEAVGRLQHYPALQVQATPPHMIRYDQHPETSLPLDTITHKHMAFLADQLLAAAPLIPTHRNATDKTDQLLLFGLPLSGPFVSALGVIYAAAPPRRIAATGCHVDGGFWPALALAFPRLLEFELDTSRLPGIGDVLAYQAAVREVGMESQWSGGSGGFGGLSHSTSAPRPAHIKIMVRFGMLPGESFAQRAERVAAGREAATVLMRALEAEGLSGTSSRSNGSSNSGLVTVSMTEGGKPV